MLLSLGPDVVDDARVVLQARRESFFEGSRRGISCGYHARRRRVCGAGRGELPGGLPLDEQVAMVQFLFHMQLRLLGGCLVL